MKISSSVICFILVCLYLFGAVGQDRLEPQTTTGIGRTGPPQSGVAPLASASNPPATLPGSRQEGGQSS